ncbi:unnamed protein product [Commensalibacter communis]|nr:unnamed protein product [Commensalibacter communis]
MSTPKNTNSKDSKTNFTTEDQDYIFVPCYRHYRTKKMIYASHYVLQAFRIPIKRNK